MSVTINQKSVKIIGILIAIVGGLIAFIGGVKIGNSVGNIWNILVGMALAAIGGLVAAIGGHISNLIK
jgi:hypothetical protein